MTFPHSAALPQVNDPRRAGSITFTKYHESGIVETESGDACRGARWGCRDALGISRGA